MERLPVEVLHHVFALACCDGGFTGRSLSLVNKSFQDVVRPLRYHSVALVSLQQIKCFLRCYQSDRAARERQGTRHALTIRHLFLRPDATVANGVDIAAYGATARQPLCDVLRLAGKTLVTLLYTGTFRWEDLLADCQCNFPNLKELTFSRYDNSDLSHPPGAQPYAQLPRRFPALRKLHVVFVRSHSRVEDVLAKWAEAAPKVSHVRLSGLRSADMPGRWMIKMSGKSHERRQYPSVRHVVLQPSKRPPQSRCGYSRGNYDAMVYALQRKLTKMPKGVKWVLLEGDAWGQTLWEDWIEGANGRADAWV